MSDDSRALGLACEHLEELRGDCPWGAFDDDWIPDICNCENCGSNAKRCWREYFRYKAKDATKQVRDD
ncbi:MAG TPA: hypothetical protein VMV86_00370 [Methanosarcinales archaeon]|nr:hypothetical protein [Methanosarcinales archaeon]